MTTGFDIAVQGGALSAWRLGAARAQAPAVVAIHGITSTSRTWLAVAEALGDRATLVAPDLRGRGRSRAVGPPYGLDAHAADIVALLDALELDDAVIAGHSLGAYVACRVATAHPERVRRLVLVDGGLPLPRTEPVADPDAFLAAFLGPVVERLRMTFPDVGAYRDWWAAHPAFAGADIEPAVLEAYAAHDLVGEPPRLGSSVDPRAVGDDGRDLLGADDGLSLEPPAVLLHAERGLHGEPPPMQPAEVVAEWAAQDPGRRRAVPVPATNHYTIVLGTRGAQVVADEIAAAVSPRDGGPALT